MTTYRHISGLMNFALILGAVFTFAARRRAVRTH